MEPSYTFFLIFIITVVVTRVFLYFKPIASPVIKGFRLHHYMYGLILSVLGIVLGSVTIFAIGIGLFVDELGFLLIGGKTHKENYSKLSLILLCTFVILVYIFKSQLLFWI